MEVYDGPNAMAVQVIHQLSNHLADHVKVRSDPHGIVVLFEIWSYIVLVAIYNIYIYLYIYSII